MGELLMGADVENGGSLSGEQQRARNIIWNAAQDYSFPPDFMALDKKGEAVFYLNSIIGFVHKWYDYDLLNRFFHTFDGAAFQELYDGLLWLGLEHCAYEREKEKRPVLEDLRREYSEDFLKQYQWTQDGKLLMTLQKAVCRRNLRENLQEDPGLRVKTESKSSGGLTKWESRLLAALSFDAALTTQQIIDEMKEVLWEFFKVRFEPGKEGQNIALPRKLPAFLRGVRGFHAQIIRDNSLHREVSREDGENNSGDDGENKKEKDGENEDVRGRGKKQRRRRRNFLTQFTCEGQDRAAARYIETTFGKPLYGEQENSMIERELCTGGHADSHLYFAGGGPLGCDRQYGEGGRKANGERSGESNGRANGESNGEANGESNGKANGESNGKVNGKENREGKRSQQEKNQEYYREHLEFHRVTVSRLSGAIRNSLLLGREPELTVGKSGSLDARRAWRAVCLNDDRVFLKKLESGEKRFAVDLMLDASASRMLQQEVIASQGYMIAESLSQCHVPVQVYSFLTLEGYTVLNLFRGYGENEKNREIFRYCAAGWNRDGLALRGAGRLMERLDCDNRILLILTDASPNDMRHLSNSGPLFPGKEYSGRAGLEDAAAEVRKLQKKGVKVLGILSGQGIDLVSARRIYGSDLIRIESMDQFSDAVGNLLREQIRKM